MVLNRAKPHKWSMRQTKENNGKHHFSGISAVTGFIWHFLYNRNKTFLKNWKKTPEKSNKKNILHHLMAANTLKSTHDNKLFQTWQSRFFMQLYHAPKILPLSSSRGFLIIWDRPKLRGKIWNQGTPEANGFT